MRDDYLPRTILKACSKQTAVATGRLERGPFPTTQADETIVQSVEETDPAQEEISRLAALPRLAYETQRKAAADRLGIRVPVLDSFVAKERGPDEATRKQPAGKSLDLSSPEPWADAVDGAVAGIGGDGWLLKACRPLCHAASNTSFP